MIVVFVMDSEFSESFTLEFTATVGADRWEHFQGLFPIPFHAQVSFAPQPGHELFVVYLIIVERHGLITLTP